jgi:hypothetical protein
VSAINESKTKEFEERNNKALSDLKTEWGDAYEQNMDQAKTGFRDQLAIEIRCFFRIIKVWQLYYLRLVSVHLLQVQVSGEDGKIVLEDLMNFCGVDRPSFDVNNVNATFLNEGTRAVHSPSAQTTPVPAEPALLLLFFVAFLRLFLKSLGNRTSL